MTEPVTRRRFTKNSALTAAAMLGSPLVAARADRQAIGANDRIRVGVIGVGNRGSQLLDAFLPHADAEIVAICDVYEPFLQRAATKLSKVGNQVKQYGDFRKLIDHPGLDAVVIATPDH